MKVYIELYNHGSGNTYLAHGELTDDSFEPEIVCDHVKSFVIDQLGLVDEELIKAIWKTIDVVGIHLCAEYKCPVPHLLIERSFEIHNGGIYDA